LLSVRLAYQAKHERLGGSKGDHERSAKYERPEAKCSPEAEYVPA